jgi:hypothetical protein
LEENDNTHGVMVGAARTLDSVGAFACGPEKLRCNSIAVHYGKSTLKYATRISVLLISLQLEALPT